MKKLLILLMLLPLTSFAQQPFTGQYRNTDLRLRLKVNLYESFPIPDDEFEGDNCYGILEGSVNGSWFFMKILSNEGNKARVRAVSDSGIEAQTLDLIFNEEKNSITIKQVDSTNIRGVKNSKYVKLPKNIVFNKL